METLVEDKEKKPLEKRIKLEVNHLKDLIQHSYLNKEFEGIVYVYPSRFRKIISDYFTLQGVYIEGMLDNYATYYDYFILSKLDDQGNNNNYKIVKDQGVRELKGLCNNCDCGRRRVINPKTNICYYKEMISENYNTKMK